MVVVVALLLHGKGFCAVDLQMVILMLFIVGVAVHPGDIIRAISQNIKIGSVKGISYSVIVLLNGMLPYF